MKHILIILFVLTFIPSNVNAKLEFEYPAIPVELTQPSQRAGFLLRNYWQSIDFKKTIADRDAEEFEQYFADFVNLFPHAEESDVTAAIDSLLEQVNVNNSNLHLVIAFAEKYLFEPESPLYDEEYYRLFLNKELSLPEINRNDKIRLQYQLDATNKNPVGSLTTDFEFETIEGKKMNLSQIVTDKNILLIFFDPDCDHCRDILGRFTNGETVEELNPEQLKIVAIYSGEEKDLWNYFALSLPENWIVGYEPMKIYDEDLYVITSMPTVYLLSPKKIVLRKNIVL